MSSDLRQPPTSNRRIGLVITELDPGGAETCLTELALHLKSHQWDVRVWSLGPPAVAPFDGLRLRLQAGAVPVEFGNAQGVGSTLRIAHWLRKQLQAFDPCVVQSMLWHANVITAWALRHTSVRLFGGMRVSEPRRWRWPIERWATRRMQKLVCVSDQVREHAALRQRIPAEKLTVIPNGVSDALLRDIDQARSVDADWERLGLDTAGQAARKILFVGRLEPQKGVVEMMESARSWLATHQAAANATDWRFIVLGRGSLLGRMQAIAERAGLSQSVVFAGWQPNAPRWMAAADMLVLPAVYEGMPNVLLEAMAAGIPFVAFAVDGVAPLLASEDGYPAELARLQLVPPGDWQALQQRLKELMSDAAIRAACGTANRQHVEKCFRLTRLLDQYLQLYE